MNNTLLNLMFVLETVSSHIRDNFDEAQNRR